MPQRSLSCGLGNGSRFNDDATSGVDLRPKLARGPHGWRGGGPARCGGLTFITERVKKRFSEKKRGPPSLSREAQGMSSQPHLARFRYGSFCSNSSPSNFVNQRRSVGEAQVVAVAFQLWVSGSHRCGRTEALKANPAVSRLLHTFTNCKRLAIIIPIQVPRSVEMTSANSLILGLGLFFLGLRLIERICAGFTDRASATSSSEQRIRRCSERDWGLSQAQSCKARPQ